MTPIDRVRQLYRQWPQPRTFEEDVRAHLQVGHVLHNDDCFGLGRAVNRWAGSEIIDDPWRSFDKADQNAWLIFAYAGRLKTILDFIPYKLQFIGFQRRGKTIRYYDFDKLLQRIRQAG